MRILAIETSCDETAISVIEASGTESDASFLVRGNSLYSQAKKHASFGGVYPSLAKREHAANLVPLLASALRESRLQHAEASPPPPHVVSNIRTVLYREDELGGALLGFAEKVGTPAIDAIAVTKGPGLEPALWVGINFARALAYLWGLPIIPVHHLEGHLIASTVYVDPKDTRTYRMSDIAFPFIGLVLSGGHTEFIKATSWGSYTLLGGTRDDSIGEAFDKVARLLGLPYPGGPSLSHLAAKGRPALHRRTANASAGVKPLPRPMIASNDLDFSFSGIKTAVRYQVRDLGELSEEARTRLATEFEEAVVEVVLKKTTRAIATGEPLKHFLLGGGVSANTYLRERLESLFRTQYPNTGLHLPAPGLSTDNAIMIGMAGYFMHLRNEQTLQANDDLTADGNLSIEKTK